jgi:hypothetical protein
MRQNVIAERLGNTSVLAPVSVEFISVKDSIQPLTGIDTLGDLAPNSVAQTELSESNLSKPSPLGVFGRLREFSSDRYAYAGYQLNRLMTNKNFGRVALVGVGVLMAENVVVEAGHVMTGVAHAADIHATLNHVSSHGSEIGSTIDGKSISQHQLHETMTVPKHASTHQTVPSNAAPSNASHNVGNGNEIGSTVDKKPITQTEIHKVMHTPKNGESHQPAGNIDRPTGITIGSTIDGKSISQHQLHETMTVPKHIATHHTAPSNLASSGEAHNVGNGSSIGSTIDHKKITPTDLHRSMHLPKAALSPKHPKAPVHIAGHGEGENPNLGGSHNHNVVTTERLPNMSHRLMPQEFNTHKAASSLNSHLSHLLRVQGIGARVNDSHISAAELHRHMTLSELNHHKPHHELKHDVHHHTKSTDHDKSKSELKDKSKQKIKKDLAKKSTKKLKDFKLKSGQNPWTVSAKELKIKGTHLTSKQLSRIWNYDKRLLKLNHLNLEKARHLAIGAHLRLPKTA